jgi:hypothetical protein
MFMKVSVESGIDLNVTTVKELQETLNWPGGLTVTVQYQARISLPDDGPPLKASKLVEGLGDRRESVSDGAADR